MIRFLPAAAGSIWRGITRAPKPKPPVKPTVKPPAKPPAKSPTKPPAKSPAKPPKDTPKPPRKLPPIKKVLPAVGVPAIIAGAGILGPEKAIVDDTLVTGNGPSGSDGSGGGSGAGGGGGGKPKPKPKPGPPGSGGGGKDDSIDTGDTNTKTTGTPGGGASGVSVSTGTPGGGGLPAAVLLARQQYDADRAAAAAANYANNAALRELFSQGIMGARGIGADIYGGRAPALLGQATTGVQRDFLTGLSAEQMRYQAALEALRRSYSGAVGEAYSGLADASLDRANERAALAAQINRLGMG